MQLSAIFKRKSPQIWKIWTRQKATILKISTTHGLNTSSKRISSKPRNEGNNNFLVSAEKYKEFLNLFPMVVSDLTNKIADPNLVEANVHDELLRYLAPFGKKLRASIVFSTYEQLEKPENITPENLRLAMIMAWALEMLQTACVLIDDVIDEGVMRRSSVCWHRKENIGLHATNDAILLEQGTYILLRKYFRNHHCYLPSMLLFHDITLKTALGEAADSMSVKNGKPQLQLFTMERFKRIAELKTGFFTFYLPIALGMYMANIYDLELHKKSEDLSKDLAFLFQVQDDFMDCYGNPHKIGKKGTDIQQGKCSWFAVMVMEKGNYCQIETMKECYGRNDPKAGARILKVYEELNIADLYRHCLDNTFNNIQKSIRQNIYNKNLQSVYFKILKSIEGRSF